MDYYKVLNLDSKTATHEDVAKAYRSMATEAHPLRVEEGRS